LFKELLFYFVVGLDQDLQDLLMFHRDSYFPSIHQILQGSQLWACVHVGQNFDGVDVAQFDGEE
jgi:hypothetical protein